MTQRKTRLVVVGVIAALLVGLVLVNRGPSQTSVTAHFDSVVGVYEGSEVRLMGVPIGIVTEIKPGPDHVTVTMAFDSTHRLPADAQAIIISPSVIADRFVQLTPVYDGSGPTLASGALIPRERTASPVELDRVYEASNEVLQTMGPNGVNKKGALNDLLGVSADNLEGNGRAMRSTLHELAGAVQTLGGGSSDLYGTVENLNDLSGALAKHDRDVARFTEQLGEISQFLGGEGDDLRETLQNLTSAFAIVETFVKDNRELLTDDIEGLVGVTGALVAEREALQALIEIAPTGLNNLNRTWDVGSQAVRTRSNSAFALKDLSGAICDAFIRGGGPDPQAACDALKTLLGGVPEVLP